MKLSLYERLMQKDWFYKLMINFTLMEYFVMFALFTFLIFSL